MKTLCIWLIRFYQKYLSPLKRSPSCRFYPSCSAYAITAYQKRGFFMGTLLMVTRIARCNPFCRCGYDPVPLKGFSNKGTFIEYKDMTRENCPAFFSSIDPGMDPEPIPEELSDTVGTQTENADQTADGTDSSDS